MDSQAMLRLTETDGGGNSSELSTIKVSDATITIGRGKEADLCFGEEDQSVSRQQFEISLSGDVPSLKNTGKNPVLYKGGKKQLAPNAKINIVSGLEVSFRDNKLRFDVVVPSVYCLKTKGAAGRAEFQVESGRKYTVGRSPECDITLDSSGVSRRHCKIQMESDEILNVHDLGSVNGVRLFLKGEVQEESSDIEVPCGVKFIIGDIECIWDRKGQGTSKKKPTALQVALPVVIVLLVLAAISYFVLKPDSPGPNPCNPIEKIQEIVQDDGSYGTKVEEFSALGKEPDMTELKLLCAQLAEYYAQCRSVEKLKGSLTQTYEQWKQETSPSDEQMRSYFDIDTRFSFKKLTDESRELKTSHQTVSKLMKENDLQEPEFPGELIGAAGQLVEKAEEDAKRFGNNVDVKTDRVHAIIRDDVSFSQKAEQFTGLAEEPELKDLKLLCKELAGYYSQCSLVETMNGSLSKEYEQRLVETRRSIEQMDFDFDTPLSSGKLKAESKKLKTSHITVAASVQEIGIEMPESHRELTDVASQLVKNADKHEDKTRRLSSIWADLEGSSFAASKFDTDVMKESIDTLYPGEGLGAETCTKVDEIINYREQISAAYQGLIGQLSLVLSNYMEHGVSKEFVPLRYDLEPLREAIEAPRPKYFVEPPPFTEVASNLYSHIDSISTEWTNLDFLAYCGRWQRSLEQSKSALAKIDDEALPLVDQLCAEASLKCAAELDKGMGPYRKITDRLDTGKDEELDFNEAEELIEVYDLCYEYLQHDLFCELQKERKKEMEVVSTDCLNRLRRQLKKKRYDASRSFDDAEKRDCAQDAKRILKTLDSAVYLPPDFKTTIEGYR